MLPVISASRRTDLIRFYPNLLADWLADGQVAVKNPVSQKVRLVTIAPQQVHTIVLWSKDFARLINNEFFLLDRLKTFRQCFIHFTITGLGGSLLEPGVQPWQQAVKQISALVAIVRDPRLIVWRFDPIVFWRAASRLESNVHYFNKIAPFVRAAGIQRVVSSLCQWYPKSRRRADVAGLTWVEPKTVLLQQTVKWMNQQASRFGLHLTACAHPGLAAAGLPIGRCIDGPLLNACHPDQLRTSERAAQGQRLACGCTHSVDIGSYDLTCSHGCLYCYANPQNEKRIL